MFDYSVVAERPEPDGERGRSRPTGGGDSGRGRPPGEGKGGMGGGNRRGGDNQEAETTSKFYDSAAAKLEETGFCREGYVELDSEFSRGKSRLRGECKETASDADRRDFPDQVVHATLKAPTRDK
ncbi:MAG: hypothetical protein QNK31_08475 [Porticoccus sp.]|nr:hypothetical protein [Porticoccus sp.]